MKEERRWKKRYSLSTIVLIALVITQSIINYGLSRRLGEIEKTLNKLPDHARYVQSTFADIEGRIHAAAGLAESAYQLAGGQTYTDDWIGKTTEEIDSILIHERGAYLTKVPNQRSPLWTIEEALKK